MIKIIRSDCLKVLKKMEDKSVDLLLTDPPFGIPGEEPIEEVLIRLKESFRVCKNMAILMDYRNFWRVDELFHDIKVGELIWEYGWVSGGRSRAKYGFFPTHNTIGLYGDKEDFRFIKGSIIHRQSGFNSPRQCSFAKKSGHKYEKPIKLMEYLLEGASTVGSIVLDPFMGSGTTGIACKNMGRDFIGVEIDRKNYLMSKNRIFNGD